MISPSSRSPVPTGKYRVSFGSEAALPSSQFSVTYQQQSWEDAPRLRTISRAALGFPGRQAGCATHHPTDKAKVG